MIPLDDVDGEEASPSPRSQEQRKDRLQLLAEDTPIRRLKAADKQAANAMKVRPEEPDGCTTWYCHGRAILGILVMAGRPQ